MGRLPTRILIILLTLVAIMPSGISISNSLGGNTEPSPSAGSTIIITESSTSQTEVGRSTGGYFAPTNGSIALDPRPSDEPRFGAIPAKPPEASTGKSVPYLYHGENPSMEELEKLGGDLVAGNDIKYYILYNNNWSTKLEAFWLDDRTNTISYVDAPQYITYFEKYPDGHVVTSEWGYMEKGFHPAYFSADEKGWHRIAIWGSVSGWSDVQWIYVW